MDEKRLIHDWMARVLQTTGWSAARWAREARTTSTNITRLLSSPDSASIPRADTLAKLIAAVPPSLGIPAPIFAVVRGDKETMGIAEVDIRVGMAGGAQAGADGWNAGLGADDIKAVWDLPVEYLIHELRIGAGQARIIEVQGDSMQPTLRSGDRVMVNLADQRPSPPGIFAVWDGFAVVVKRVEPIPNSEPPTLRLISDNAHHGVYERVIGEVSIIGRVVWFSRRL